MAIYDFAYICICGYIYVGKAKGGKLAYSFRVERLNIFFGEN